MGSCNIGNKYIAMILQLQVLMVLIMVATVMRFASKYFSEPHYISKNGYSQTEKSKVIKK